MKQISALVVLWFVALVGGCASADSSKKAPSSYSCHGSVQLCLVVISKDANGKFIARPDQLTTSQGVGKTIVWAFAEPEEYIFDLVRPKAEMDRVEAVRGKPLPELGVRPCYPTDDPALGSRPVSQGRYWRCDIRGNAELFTGLEYQVYFHSRDGKQHRLDPTMSNNGGPTGGVAALVNENLSIRPGIVGGTYLPSKDPVNVRSDTYISWQAPSGFMFWDDGSASSDRLSLSDGSVPICWVAETATGGASEQLMNGPFFNCFFVPSDSLPLNYTLSFRQTKDSAKSTVSGTLGK